MLKFCVSEITMAIPRDDDGRGEEEKGAENQGNARGKSLNLNKTVFF